MVNFHQGKRGSALPGVRTSSRSRHRRAINKTWGCSYPTTEELKRPDSSLASKDQRPSPGLFHRSSKLTSTTCWSIYYGGTVSQHRRIFNLIQGLLTIETQTLMHENLLTCWILKPRHLAAPSGVLCSGPSPTLQDPN